MINDSLKSHFLNLYSMALTDTHVDTKELELLYSLGVERGISTQDLQELLLNPQSVTLQIPEPVEEKVEYLYDFARMAAADGKIDEYERIALVKFCRKFGFEEDNLESITDFLLDEALKHTSPADVLELVQQNS